MSSMCIAFTVHNRPQYLREVLNSWSKVRGIASVPLLFRCEPGCPEAVELCEAVSFAPHTVIVNPEHYGVSANPWWAFECAFNGIGHEFCVLAEEDITVSSDVLEYFQWCRKTYCNDLNVLGVTTYQAEPVAPASHVVEADWSEDEYWHFWVWGTWRSRWAALLRDTWDFDYSRNGWDWDFRDRLVLGKAMKMASPGTPRSQHIGQFGSTHSPPDDYLFNLLKAEEFTEDVPVQRYESQF